MTVLYMCMSYSILCVCAPVQGIEDAQGNMDFKVAGTSEGITSLQVYTHVHVIEGATVALTVVRNSYRL